MPPPSSLERDLARALKRTPQWKRFNPITRAELVSALLAQVNNYRSHSAELEATVRHNASRRRGRPADAALQLLAYDIGSVLWDSYGIAPSKSARGAYALILESVFEDLGVTRNAFKAARRAIEFYDL